jgi:hypothetical protein
MMANVVAPTHVAEAQAVATVKAGARGMLLYCDVR